jgi:DNA polymerase-3 subunit delta
MKKKSAPAEFKGTADVYLFYGDEFLVKEQVTKLVDRVLEPQSRDTNFTIFDGANPDMSALSTHLFTPSLFGGARVILVDQTAIFMGRSDNAKVMNKTLESWRTGDRKTALRAFGQLLSVVGVPLQDVADGSDWLGEIDESIDREDREALLKIAKAFQEEGRTVSRGDEDLMEEFINSSLPEETTLVFTAAGVDKRKKIFKAVEKRGLVLECAIRQEKYGSGLDRSFFEERVRETLRQAGKDISRPALEKMYARCGTEMRRLQSELDKLIGYVGARAAITEEDVETLFADFHQAAFFDLNNALRTGDIVRCLPALHENLKIVAHPLQTLGSIATEFRRLMVARELLFTVFKASWRPGMQYNSFVSCLKQAREENPTLMGKGKFKLLSSLKDYPLYLYLRDAQKFPMDKLVAILEKILEVDVLLKSSKIGAKAPQSLMEDLVFTICAASRGNARNQT